MRDIIGELQGRDAEGLAGIHPTNLRSDPQHARAAKADHRELNGTTAGAGACIALASDIRIAAEEAKIASFSSKLDWPARTWARLICCRASSVWRKRLSC